MKVNIISKEIIKPSFPTPSHLHNFHLSLIDWLAPSVYVPILLFYSDDDDAKGVKIPEKIRRLKSSLSETLTRFYPLAGRVIKNGLVECNDEGINFFEAQVNCQFEEVLRQTDGEELKHLLPSDYCSMPSAKNVVLAVQVNVFCCGQMAIGVCISHKISDGVTFGTFVNAWAATAYGSSEFLYPTFDSASLFPIEDVSRIQPTIVGKKEKIVTKSFKIDESTIDTLRGKDPKGTAVGYPTRVESVSALIWRCAMRARAEVVPRRPKVGIHAVNMRGRMVPPLPEYSFGNLFGVAVAALGEIGEIESECGENTQRYLEGRLRDAIRALDADYMNKKRGSQELLRVDITAAFTKGDLDVYGFSSWCRFPFYDADFGWGKPIWVSSAWVPFKNFYLLLGRRWGDGMEVWASMTEEDMAKFEQDEELLAHCVKLGDSDMDSSN